MANETAHYAEKVGDTKQFVKTFCVMFWPSDPAKNAIQGDAPEGSAGRITTLLEPLCVTS